MKIEQRIYSFEFAFETAFARVLAENDIVVYTPSNDEFLTDDFKSAHPELVEYLPDTLTFQKQRPRVELEFVLGPGKGILRPINNRQPVNGSMPETSYSAAVKVTTVTEADPKDHRAFNARLRRLFDTIREAVNETDQLALHSLQQLRPGGASPTYKAEDGVYQTELHYDLDFCIRADAWAQLEQ